MLTGLKTVVPIAREIFSYERKEMTGALISFLQHCCIFAPRSTLKGLFVVCFPGVTTHRGCIFHSPVAGFSLLVFEVS
jgi:hypothetical protein